MMTKEIALKIIEIDSEIEWLIQLQVTAEFKTEIENLKQKKIDLYEDYRNRL